MTSEGLGEMFGGAFADTCGDKNSAHVDPRASEEFQHAQTGSEDPIGVSEIFCITLFYSYIFQYQYM